MCLENRSIHTLANHSLGLAVHVLNVSGVWDGMWLSLSIWARSCGQAVSWVVYILLVFFFYAWDVSSSSEEAPLWFCIKYFAFQ